MDEKSGGSKKVQRIEVIDSFPLEKGRSTSVLTAGWLRGRVGDSKKKTPNEDS